jgi:transmembrane sensor
LENIKHKIEDSRVFSIRKSIVRISKIAALVIILLSLGGILNYVMFNMSENNVQYCITHSPLGSKSELTLPDGTKISLNAGSTLRYPANFMKGTREVFLEGEAYFNVTKMKDRLFVVLTSDVKIKVYGTQFNVKSYPDENQIQTTLVEGSLSVEPIRGKTKNSTVILKPNQSVTFYKHTVDKTSNKELTDKGLKEVTKQPSRIVVTPLVDPLPIISWKDSKWVFVGEELDQLALKLERRYNVNITFSDESLKHYRFSGTLKSQTFEQVLKIIQESAPIQFTIENNNVIFREDPAYKKKYDTMINNPN